MTEVEKLRGENAVLREALKGMLSAVSGMYIEFVEREMQIQEAESIGRKALSSTPLSEKAAKVLEASVNLEIERNTHGFLSNERWGDYIRLLREWESAVDAYRKERE